MKIQIKAINKTFQLKTGEPLQVLKDINLDIAEGDFLVILGESGCGKSTLLNLAAGMQPPTSGEILMDGETVTAPHPSRILLFQHPSLLPWLNTADNIAFGCKLRGDLENLEERTRRHIELMGLSGNENVHPAELSVGMAHRVCLARALIGKPDVMLLDEPFRSLDTINRLRLLDELISIWKTDRFSAIFVTHNIEEALLLGNKIVLLAGQPATVQKIFPVDLPYPRDVADEHFIRIRQQIFTVFKDTYGGILP